MKFLSMCFLLILSTLINASEYPSALQEESDFESLSKVMEQKSLGLVLMFHAAHCPYCALMENEILSPMVKSGEYDDKVIIRKLQIDEARDVKDFKGNIVEPSDISDRYGATLTPTLVFLDANGNEKAKKMIGINTVELFGAYLDDNIDVLLQNMKTKMAKQNNFVTPATKTATD